MHICSNSLQVEPTTVRVTKITWEQIHILRHKARYYKHISIKTTVDADVRRVGCTDESPNDTPVTTFTRALREMRIIKQICTTGSVKSNLISNDGRKIFYYHYRSMASEGCGKQVSPKLEKKEMSFGQLGNEQMISSKSYVVIDSAKRCCLRTFKLNAVIW